MVRTWRFRPLSSDECQDIPLAHKAALGFSLKARKPATTRALTMQQPISRFGDAGD